VGDGRDEPVAEIVPASQLILHSFSRHVAPEQAVDVLRL